MARSSPLHEENAFSKKQRGRAMTDIAGLIKSGAAKTLTKNAIALRRQAGQDGEPAEKDAKLALADQAYVSPPGRLLKWGRHDHPTPAPLVGWGSSGGPKARDLAISYRYSEACSDDDAAALALVGIACADYKNAVSDEEWNTACQYIVTDACLGSCGSCDTPAPTPTTAPTITSPCDDKSEVMQQQLASTCREYQALIGEDAFASACQTNFCPTCDSDFAGDCDDSCNFCNPTSSPTTSPPTVVPTVSIAPTVRPTCGDDDETSISNFGFTCAELKAYQTSSDWDDFCAQAKLLHGTAQLPS